MNNEQCLALIEHYKNRRFLWDSRDKKYHNKNLREDAWREISQLINFSVADAKKKMTILMGSYRRERSRYKQRLTSGSGRDDIYNSKWFAYESFDFLADKNQSTVRADTLVDNNELNYENPLEIADVETAETLTSTPEWQPARSSKANSSASTSHTKKRRPTSETGDYVLQEAIALLRKSSDGNNTDPYTSFGQYIANELRKYDPQTLSHVKHAINTIIFEADMGKYQQPISGYDSQYHNAAGRQSTSSSELLHPAQIPSPSPHAMQFSEGQESDISESNEKPGDFLLS